MSEPEARNQNSLDLDALAGDDLTIEPDIEIIGDPTQPDVVQIGSELYLRLDDVSVVGDPEIDPLMVAEPRWRIFERVSPEVVAGVVIGLLVALFVVLMYLGVSDQQSDQGSSDPAATAPAAEVEVEIGTAVVLERE